MILLFILYYIYFHIVKIIKNQKAFYLSLVYCRIINTSFGRKNTGLMGRRVDVPCHKNCTGSDVPYVSKTVRELMRLMVEKL